MHFSIVHLRLFGIEHRPINNVLHWTAIDGTGMLLQSTAYLVIPHKETQLSAARVASAPTDPHAHLKNLQL